MSRALLVAVLLACAAATAPRAERLAVDGAQLYLLVRGEDPRAPVVLWLHGGPGGAETPLFRLFNGDLEQRFVVAYWDQRGAGRSFDPDADPRALTIARHLADLDAVVDHLRARLGQDRVALLGHSWGSALGLLYARTHPQKLSAFIGVGQLTSELARQRAQHEFVRTEAERRGDADAKAALEEIGEPPLDAKRELALERWVDRYGGVFHRRPSFAWALLRGTVFGYVAPWEIPRFIRANEISLAAMNRELLALDLTTSVPGVDVPVFFFLGRHDRQVDSRLAAAYFESLAAPRKQLVWFERSAHNVPFEEPQAFNAAVIRALAPSGEPSEAPAPATPR